MIDLMLAVSLLLDDKDDVKNAAKKAADAGSYAFTSTTKSEGGGGGGGGGGRARPGPIEGKIGDGVVWMKSTIGETAYEALVKGEKSAIKGGDEWKSSADFASSGGGGGGGRPDPMSMVARGLKGYKAPADEAQSLVDKLAAIKNDGDGAYSGDLTEEGAKAMLTRGGGGGGRVPEIAEPSGSAKFWVKDGVLVKYEYTVKGKMTLGEREMDINRTTTVEIKDVGATKVEIPEEAQKLLE